MSANVTLEVSTTAKRVVVQPLTAALPESASHMPMFVTVSPANQCKLSLVLAVNVSGPKVTTCEADVTPPVDTPSVTQFSVEAFADILSAAS